jgi:exodeoxyribonuclease III
MAHTFRLVSFNINGLRSRIHQLSALLERHRPDVVGLQEIKCPDDQFPVDEVAPLNYSTDYFGQKSHYGVALLSKQPPLAIEKGFPGDDEEAQRRLILGRYTLPNGGELTVINGYFPQGESRDHDTKFPAKQKFYADLMQLLETRFKPSDPLVIMGDFNISPQDLDIGIGEDSAKRWLRQGKCSFLPEERAWYQRLLDWGLADGYRLRHPDLADFYTWFDYRSRAFEFEPKRGLRIDHLLITAPLRPHLVDAGIDYEIRGMDKPSDHAPTWIELRFD